MDLTKGYYIFGQGSSYQEEAGVGLKQIEKAEDNRNPKNPKGYAFVQGVNKFFQEQDGIRKPTNISFRTLRRLAKSLSVAAICKTTIKNKISLVDWDLIEKDKNAAQDSHREYVMDLLKKPNRNKVSFRTNNSMLLEDLIDLDAGVIEKVRNLRGELCELWIRDGAVIRPLYDDFGIAWGYVQVDDNGKILAEWSNDDMIYLTQHPSASQEGYGYGFAALEGVMMSATAMLMTDQYNSSYFNNATLPPALIDLGPGVSAEMAEKFRDDWVSDLQGPSQKWAMPIGNFTDAKILPLRATNQEMEFMQYQYWLRDIIIAAYMLSPQDVGAIQDVNRSTAQSQEGIAESKGVRSTLDCIAEFINAEVIEDLGFGNEFEFAWKDLDKLDEKIQADIENTKLNNGSWTINQVRVMRGEEPIAGGEKPYVNSKTITFLDGTYLEDMTEDEVVQLRKLELNDGDDESVNDDIPQKDTEPTPTAPRGSSAR